MNILFVCTGNICRSPFAEKLAAHLAQQQALGDLNFASAGVLASPGDTCSESSIKAARELGVDLSSHLARPLSDELLEWASLVVVMEDEQARSVRDFAPNFMLTRIQNLASYAPGPNRPLLIPDPHRAGFWAHQASYRFISVCVERMMEIIKVLEKAA